MTSSYRKTVEQLEEQVGPARMPCHWCQESTLVTVLNQHGARCMSCYEAYCRKGISGMTLGYADGRQDTVGQAEMRKRVRTA